MMLSLYIMPSVPSVTGPFWKGRQPEVIRAI